MKRWISACSLAFAACLALGSLAHAGVGSISEPSTRTPAAPRASVDSTGAPLRRTVSWSAGPLERCDYFVITEASIARMLEKDDSMRDWIDRHVISNRLGLMRNVTGRDAVGASLALNLYHGAITLEPSVRYRRWFGARQSAEAGVGFVQSEHSGLDGLQAEVRYYPVPELFAEAGVRDVHFWEYRYEPDRSFGHYVHERRTHTYAGVGMAGAPSTLVWVGEVLAGGALFVIVGSMSD